MSYGRCQRHYRCHPRRRPCIRTVSSTQTYLLGSISTFAFCRLSGTVTTQTFVYLKIYGGDDYRRNILIVSCAVVR